MQGREGVASSGRIIRGVVFDMDGTLTIPVIDFMEMRRRAGIPPGQDILDAITSWTDNDRKERAYAEIAEIEEEALQNMKIMPGCLELCSFLDSNQVPRGLITRNVKKGVSHFHQHHLQPLSLQHFEPAISRECQFPYKPSPDALLHICQTWGIAASECIMVGDSAKDDIVCGNRAGSVTILLDYNAKEGHSMDRLQGEQRPTHIVTSLLDIVHLLQQHYVLSPASNPHNVVVSNSDA